MTIETSKQKQVIDITNKVQDTVSKENMQNGLCNVFVLHTTAAVTTADLDPGTDLDYLDALAQMVPQLNFRHPHNPSHFPDHLLASLIGPSISVPVQNGELVLGVWQRIVLFEFDGPRQRDLHITTVSSHS
jgi:secondary thiamine-phosphate synthase enzyme